MKNNNSVGGPARAEACVRLTWIRNDVVTNELLDIQSCSTDKK